MKIRFIAASLALFAAPAFAHTLDEYVQATVISVEKDRVHAQMRMVPGAMIADGILAAIDTDRNGQISAAEQRAYADRVLHDVSLTVDGKRLTPRLVAVDFPDTALIKEGVGEIRIDLDAALPPGGTTRKLTFENRHQSRVAAYMTNCVVPSDPNIRIVAQRRNERQSSYQLEYTQSAKRAST